MPSRSAFLPFYLLPSAFFLQNKTSYIFHSTALPDLNYFFPFTFPPRRLITESHSFLITYNYQTEEKTPYQQQISIPSKKAAPPPKKKERKKGYSTPTLAFTLHSSPQRRRMHSMMCIPHCDQTLRRTKPHRDRPVAWIPCWAMNRCADGPLAKNGPPRTNATQPKKKKKKRKEGGGERYY